MFPGWGGGGVFDDDAYDDDDREDRRRPLGLADAFRCGLFLGPICCLLGVILLVSAAADPQERHYRVYTAAVSAWESSGREAFAQALPAGAATGAAPVLLYIAAPGSGDLLTIPLYASAALPPPTYNASRRERNAKAAAYPALSFVGTATSAYATAWPSTSSAYASVNATGGGVLSAPVVMASCSDTVGLQEGIDCSADSPPAPAPGQATDENALLMDLERRKRRRMLGNPPSEAAGGAGWAEGAGGLAAHSSSSLSAVSGTPQSGRRHALQLMQSFVPASAVPPVADAGAVLGSDNDVQLEGGTSRDSTAQDGVALGNAWATGVADGEVPKPRPTTCHGCESTSLFVPSLADVFLLNSLCWHDKTINK